MAGRGTSAAQPVVLLVGATTRIALILLAAPSASEEWFARFLNIRPGNVLNPWAAWLSAKGDVLAFPYGWTMWAFLRPPNEIATGLGLRPELGYMLALLVADIALFLVLRFMFASSKESVTLLYWLSPIVIVATYVFGANDVIPTLLLTASLALLSQRRSALAGIVLAIAVATKLSMIIALPLIVIYFLHHREARANCGRFGVAFIGAGVIALFPVVTSDAAIRMITSNPELKKVYGLSISGLGVPLLYVIPLLVLLVVYAAWRVKRPSLSLIVTFIGVAFLIIVLLTPASPGWYVWLVPFLVAFQVWGDRTLRALVLLFSGLFVLGATVISPFVTSSPTYSSQVAGLGLPILEGGTGAALVHTLLVGTGLVIGVRAWRQSSKSNDYLGLSQQPFSIGIAGDSGSGKDHLANALEDVFGPPCVTRLSGDDYHLWDRRKPIWRTMTHLNPGANDLDQFANDVVALTDGQNVRMRRYDHATGLRGRTEQVRSNEFILISGLHVLYLPIVRERLRLRVFLAMDERLRQNLKLQRDTSERNHQRISVQNDIHRRKADASRYIKPQMEHADIVFGVRPAGILHDTPVDGPRMDLVVRSRHGFDYSSITRVLSGVCGLSVETEINDKNSFPTVVRVEGFATPDDVSLAVKLVCARLIPFLSQDPQWSGGTTGLMQLFTLAHMDRVLARLQG